MRKHRLICAFVVRIWQKQVFEVWPSYFLTNVFTALKGTHFYILFAFTAAGVVQCGGRKMSICNNKGADETVRMHRLICAFVVRIWQKQGFEVWPIYFLTNVFTALKGTHFCILFAFTAAGVVQCGDRKTSPRTSTIVQFIFHFSSFEISEHTLRNQNLIIGLDSCSRQHFIYVDPILIYMSLWIDCLFEIHKIAACFPLHFGAKSLQGHWWGFFSQNFEVWPSTFLRMCSLLKERTFVFLFLMTWFNYIFN